ncbi:class I SAM-dependent DNA methyltransferase [Tellurirhabdus bombi]|uniref:class I SAM-dependent DNA methyltransferase n=1 Tax=Tellurirhabdus bombi TaxID=2907205 RepID=UPI001F46CD6B|nr:class I SAM-dependent methyltransferase [Tellurirhabdus bombi]
MIGKRDEYEKMFRLEQRLWWYRILHGRVLQAIQRQFGKQFTRQGAPLRILDAGCGTGGLLFYLRNAGYTDLRGIDGSEDAVAFSRERGLDVSLLNLNNLVNFQPGQTFDVIICNDVFCYFDDPGLIRLMQELARRLRPGGLLISNNNAFDIFRGSHDQAIGSQRRFVRADFENLAPKANLRIKDSTYWSLALSPLILGIRLWQSFQLKVGLQSADKPASDVYFPGNFVNETLYRIVRTEQTLLPRTPFGSSLFTVFNH